jgi:hypothetical protein
MKKALICPNEPVQAGYRIAQVGAVESVFPVADPLFWMDCEDNVVADQFWFNPSDNTIVEIPQVVANTTPVGGEPSVIA